MKIIGHRGAAGLALENSLESIYKAKELKLAGFEIDIRLTADKKFILSHDESLARVSDQSYVIKKTPLKTIRNVKLLNNESVPTLREALKAAGSMTIYLEPKGKDWATHLALQINAMKTKHNIKVISFNHRELMIFHHLSPNIPIYLVERLHAFEVIRNAKRSNINGVDLNFWILNPISYWYAKHYKLEIIVYTVNSAFIARFLKILYPEISITTDIPHRI